MRITITMGDVKDEHMNKTTKQEEVSESKAECKREVEQTTVVYQEAASKPDPNLRPPERDVVPSKGVPINIPTRGEVAYQQIGVLYKPDSESDTVIPLYGRPTYTGSDYWNYYIQSPGYHAMKIGLRLNRDCMDVTGCKEISSGDTVVIPELGGRAYLVKLYNFSSPKYLPGVI